MLGEFNPFPHQIRAVAECRSLIGRLIQAKQPPRAVVVSPCGSGKTVMSSLLMASAIEKGKTSIFMAHGRQLIYQKSRTLAKAGINHSVLMAGVPDFWHSRVIVASKDTYESRDFRLDRDLWIIDEAHLAMSENWLGLIPHDAVVVGMTATPALGDGKGLGGFYNALVRAATYEELISTGLIVPARVWAPWSVDYRGLGKHDGDWSWDAIAGRFDGLTGNVVRDWKELGQGRPTAVFASNVAHSIALCEEFNGQGIPAAHVDAGTPQSERDAIFNAVAAGNVQVVCNFGVLTVGFDLPCISCCVLAFSTASLVKYLQVVGRGLRSAAGKRDCIVIDHGDNVRRHGWPTEDHSWSLDDRETVSDRDAKSARERGVQQQVVCRNCGAMRQGGPVCPHCGHRAQRRGVVVRMQDGSLAEIRPEKRERSRITDHNRLWRRCLGICAHKGMTVAQARILFHKEAGIWPPGTVSPLPESVSWNVKVSKLYPQYKRVRQ